MDMEAKQYARMESPGLLVMLEGNEMAADLPPERGDLGTMNGSRCEDGEELKFRISMSSFLLSSMIAESNKFWGI